MTLVQLQLRRSELRETLAKLGKVAEPSDEQRAEAAKLEAELAATEAEYRKLLSEQAEVRASDGGESSARERLEERASLASCFAAAAQGSPYEGAERELAQAEGLRDHDVPWALLGPSGQELRASTNAPSDVGRQQAPILERVFARTAAAFLGVAFESVSSGERTLPVITAGNTPAQYAKGADAGAPSAGTIASFTLSPVRSQIGYEYRYEDAALLGNQLEPALRSDLRMSLRTWTDKLVIQGSGSSNQPNGFTNELTAPADPGAGSAAEVLKVSANSVDGIYAMETRDVRLLVGTGFYRYYLPLMTSTGGLLAKDIWAQVGGFRVSAHIPAAVSNIELGVAVAGRPMRHAVLTSWGAPRLIRDEVTQAGKGMVRITLLSLWDFKIIREAPFKLLKFRIA